MASTEETLERLRRLRRATMPSSRTVVRETLERLGYQRLAPSQVRAGFNDLLRQIFRETLRTLENYEQQVDGEHASAELVQCQSQAIAELTAILADSGVNESSVGAVLADFLRRSHPILRGYYLSVSQSRRQRGGKDFEYQLEFLLQLARIPYEAQPRRERVDFILPFGSYLEEARRDAVIISLKRTLRERWEQIADELHRTSCPNIYLATTEEVLGERALEGVRRYNVEFVVWDEVKDGLYAGNALVRGFSYLIERIGQVYMPRWPSS